VKVEEFLLKENLKEDFEKIIKEIEDFFKLHNLKFEMNFEIFKDIINPSWEILKIIIKCYNCSNYYIFYLLDSLKSIEKKCLSKNKYSKIVIIISNE